MTLSLLKVTGLVCIYMQGYYINLDERTDRHDYFEQYNKKQYSFFHGIERFSAFKHEVWAIGCATAHYSSIF